jgi:hypothetical protein
VPYVTPSQRQIEYTFDLTDEYNIVAESRTSDEDVFDVPNWWRFVMNGLTAAPVEGTNQYTYIDGNPGHATSYPNRQRYIKSINFIDAADYPTLVASAQVTIDSDLSPAATFNVSTSPFPLAWHFDQILYADPNLPNLYNRVQAQSWELALDGTADSTWIWEAI